MVSFLKRRFQVFVSSTYTDLREERQAAVEAILSAGHIPAGMELFAAGDESQMEVIKQWIDESDVYLLILGGRYGSIDPASGKSYIQLEYEYALEKKKPFFACLIEDAALERRVKELGTGVIETLNGNAMQQFRTAVKTKLVKFWEDAKDIKVAVTETLFQFSRRDDIGGWIRQDSQANVPALADEIARLSKENAQLRQTVSTGPEALVNGMTYRDLKEIVEREGTLAFLNANLPILASDSGFFVFEGKSVPELAKLDVLGLLDSDGSFRNGYRVTVYKLSRAGRKFLIQQSLEAPPPTVS